MDVRLIAATNRDLEAAVEAGRFRSDLYYRLRVIELELPPLRERIEDVSRLLDTQLHRFNGVLGRDIRGFTPSARAVLEAYAWPGNVRELINVVERAVLLCLGRHLPCSRGRGGHRAARELVGPKLAGGSRGAAA